MMAADPKPQPRKRDPELLRQMHLEGGVCAAPRCGETRYLELDHIIRRAQGGDDTRANLRFLCKSCHTKRHMGLLDI
jgi:5-methylcytosine-specific restriction endonuclease McrA